MTAIGPYWRLLYAFGAAPVGAAVLVDVEPRDGPKEGDIGEAKRLNTRVIVSRAGNLILYCWIDVIKIFESVLRKMPCLWGAQVFVVPFLTVGGIKTLPTNACSRWFRSGSWPVETIDNGLAFKNSQDCISITRYETQSENSSIKTKSGAFPTEAAQP